MRSSATLLTPNARKYMIQLCKHFGHRASATYGEREGEIVFEVGKVGLRAAPQTLMLRAEAPETSGIERLEQVIESHLKRFAFREPEMALDWRRAPPPV
ncbi:DUF2218 domain-containing protein [Phenylobacterium sp.]|uniref:DUF2218 domain-containing protein n=1 Tax=Phenylobacterium sp. TaxID=1871053 RepID=UPI001222AD47|nr:DUF2218 domain-containing protein [Phenylobacterium sp.]THD57720.1 MAG: DUF2218 domain-containing protein [Phenylobacterium sp.]